MAAAVVAVLAAVAVVALLAWRDSGPPVDGARYADRLSIDGGSRAEVARAVAPFDGEIVSEVDQQANPPAHIVRFPVDEIDELVTIAEAIEEGSGLEAVFVPAPTDRPIP